MPEHVRCTKCKKDFLYAGHPAYIGCPECGHTKHIKHIKHEAKCDRCGGTGKIMTSEVKDDRFRFCDTDGKAAILHKETMEEMNDG